MFTFLIARLSAILGDNPLKGFVLTSIQSLLGLVIGEHALCQILLTWRTDLIFWLQVLAYTGAVITACFTIIGWCKKLHEKPYHKKKK